MAYWQDPTWNWESSITWEAGIPGGTVNFGTATDTEAKILYLALRKLEDHYFAGDWWEVNSTTCLTLVNAVITELLNRAIPLPSI